MLDGWTDRVPPLRGDLTTIREIAASDVYTLFTLFSDPAVSTYMALRRRRSLNLRDLSSGHTSNARKAVVSASESFLMA